MVNNMEHGLPKFSLLGYDDWKIMMEAHLYALHDCMWMVLEDGPLKIQMENLERNPATPDVVQYIPKPKEKWDDRDCKKHNLDNDMASLKNTSTNEVILTGKRIRNIYEVIWDDVKEACLISKDKDEEVNKGDRIKPTEFIPFRSLPPKISQKNPDSDSAEPSGNFDQPSNFPDISNGDNSGNGNSVPIHPETPTTSILQPEAELDQPVNPNQHNLRWLRDHPPQQIIGDIQSGVRTRSAQQNLEAMLACFISQPRLQVKVFNLRFTRSGCKKVSIDVYYRRVLERLKEVYLYRLKFEEEVLEFYRNGEIKTAHSKKDPQRTVPVIKSTVGGTKVKLSQKKLGEKLRLPNSGVEVGKFPVKNLDWNIIGISGRTSSGPAKKADLNNDYKLVLELVIACLECGSGGHADDITQERAFIINSLITKTKVNWAAHFFNSISKHLGKPNQKYLCQGLYLGRILGSMGIASKGKKYEERYWLYYLSSKGENRAGTSATAEESSSDNIPLIHMTKTTKRKKVVSPSIEAPQNLAPINLEEEEESSDQGELQRKKKRKINSPSTSGNVNPDELKEKETTEETSAHNRSPQQFEEEIPQVQSPPTSSQPQTDDADNQFWQLYYDWKAWKVWQRNPEDLHLEYLANTPVSDSEADDEDTAVFKPIFSKATEDQVALTSEATAEDFQTFPETSPAVETETSPAFQETSHASEMVLTEVVQEKATPPSQEQNQETADEEFQPLIQSQVLEILTTPCEISNPTEIEIPEKSAEIPE
ncbi:unnamed protein product [Cuscuta campestris]|uniref:Uncharacterized protein n=1 Tax=Cuscuta campestris TaxID=132261 RepID=A0A484N9H1_9ASTE|nr:unnamed protein product [Cuscuta campestris]